MAKYDITESLRRVFEYKGIPKCCYSIGEYKEGAVCIERTETGYVVYDAKKAEKNNTKEYERSIDAARELIWRVAITKKDAEELQDEFNTDVILTVIDLGLI